MIKSMTGFASLTHEDERATIGVTVRAVNHRFLDLQLRLPQSFGDLEPRVRALLQKRLARGRVELGHLGAGAERGTPTVELNEEFASALAAAIEQARSRGLVSGALTPGDLLRLPQAITVRERSLEADPARRGAARRQRRGRGRAGAGRSRRDARARRRAPARRSRRAGSRLLAESDRSGSAWPPRTGASALEAGCASGSTRSRSSCRSIRR